MSDAPDFAALGKLAVLRDLDNRAWRFIAPQDHQGDFLGVVGTRVHPDGTEDTFLFCDLADCHATRTTGDGQLVWKHDGNIGDVVDAICALPAPDSAKAPRDVIGPSAPSLWVTDP